MEKDFTVKNSMAKNLMVKETGRNQTPALKAMSPRKLLWKQAVKNSANSSDTAEALREWRRTEF